MVPGQEAKENLNQCLTGSNTVQMCGLWVSHCNLIEVPTGTYVLIDRFVSDSCRSSQGGSKSFFFVSRRIQPNDKPFFLQQVSRLLVTASPFYNLTMATIEIRNLSKTYRVYQKQEGVLASVKGLFRREHREVHAVRNIDLTVEEGEFVAFLGPNGAGKTTTLKLLSGVINPDHGTVTVLGHVPWKRENEYRRKFALVMGQKNQLWWDLPAMESFRLNQHIYRVPKQEFERTRDELTEMLDVTELLGRPVRELSLGERMKMELIAALLHKPDVLFLDEPTIGLDVVAQHKIQEFLKDYQQEQKNTIMLTSHYMKDIEALCKRVVVIANGSIYHDGSLEDIVDQFSGDKIVTLHLHDDQALEPLAQLPNVMEVDAPKIKFRVKRDEVGKVLSQILAAHVVDDIVVEDPPLEEVISNLFLQAEEHGREEQQQTAANS